VADAIGDKGGMDAANLKVAQQYVEAFANLAKTNNTLILPTNVADVAGVVATAMTGAREDASAAGRSEGMTG